MTGLQLGALVRFCLERRAPPDTFHALLKQLNHKQEVSEQDIESLLSTTDPFDALLVVYISFVSLNDQTTTKFKFSNILANLKNATENNQYLVLSAFATELRSEKDHSNIVFSCLDINENIQSIFKYLKHLLNQKQDNDVRLFQSFTNLLVVLLPQLTQGASAVTSEQTDLLTTFIIETKSKCGSLSDELDEIIAKITNRSSISGIRQSISINPSINSYSSHSAFLKTNKLPKFIWLNSAILNWETHKDNFLSMFDQFLKVKTNKNTLNELLAISFEGFVIVLQSKNKNSFFYQNWRLFILKRLPLLINELNLKNVELSLINAIHLIDPKIFQTIKLLSSDSSPDSNFDDMFSSFPSTTTDVRHDFLKACISLNLLQPSAFKTVLNDDAAADGRSLPTTDDVFDDNNLPVDFLETLSSTLIDINTEFIPLEDSGLLKFLNSINDMEGSKQVEVSQLILSTILKFIKEDDKSHIYRLALAFGLSTNALSVVMFHLSPAAILKPLMNFLDKSQTDSDDMNFQDNYSAFGCTFLLFLIIVKRFNVGLSALISYKEDINQSSFCIKYLTTLGTSRQIVEDSSKIEILNNWMTALFDSGGISDDLMRLSTVQECFEIFPSIFQHAYIGSREEAVMDLDTAKGGLEYFLQPFLLSTIVGFLVWSENYLWRNDKYVEPLVSLLKTLLCPLDLSGESVYIHKVIVNNFTKGLFKVLERLDSSPSETKIDPDFLSALRQASENDTSPSGFFEYDLQELTSDSPVSKNSEESSASSFPKRKFKNASLLESFHQKFQILMNWSQSSSIPTIDYQSLTILAHLLGQDRILDYFLSQITASQSLSNGKTSQLLIEVSSFFLVVHNVTSSNKNKILKAFKNETLVDDPNEVVKDYYKLVKTLIGRKKMISENATLEDDVFLIFYDKLIEDIQTIGTLN